MTIEALKVNGGGFRITDIIDGRYYSRLYIGWNKRGAVAHFKKSLV